MTTNTIENPFGVMDVPSPFDRDVLDFAGTATLDGAADDENAAAWRALGGAPPSIIDGAWASRWKGAADPTIAGDTADKWKAGDAQIRTAGGRLYLKFDWNGGARLGLIEARRTGSNGLVGKYINLSNPKITRPWIGLIVDKTRIDGRFPEGRLDFRR